MRSSTGRRSAISRSCLRNPRGSAMEYLHDPSVDGVTVEPVPLGLGARVEHTPVVAGHDLGQALERAGPVRQQFLGDRRAGLLVVASHQVSELLGRVVRDGAEVDQLAVDAM